MATSSDTACSGVKRGRPCDTKSIVANGKVVMGAGYPRAGRSADLSGSIPDEKIPCGNGKSESGAPDLQFESGTTFPLATTT